MDSFTKNYWSLYLDFLDMFEEVQFKGYSLPYLCHFRSLIKNNTELMNHLEEKVFQRHFKNKVTEEKEIQDRFNKFIKKHRKRKFNCPKDGKIVLFDIYNLLRFPNETLLNDFGENKAMLFIEKIKNRPIQTTTIPIHHFDDYTINTNGFNDKIEQVQKQVHKLFIKYKDHFMVSNKYFQRIFMMQVIKIMNRIVEVNKLFDEQKVSVCIVPSTHYPECRTLVMIAQERGIPTICMQHGIISGGSGYLPKIAQIDAVYGQFEVDWYKRSGIDERHLEIVGHPRFDELFSRKKLTKTEFMNELRLNRKKKTVLVGVRGEQNIEKWREFLRILTRENSFNIILRDFPNVKHHPLLDEFPNVFTGGNFHLYDLIHHVDAVVVYSSTMALEAMMARKPVFIMNHFFPSYTGYFNSLEDLVQKHPLKVAINLKKYFTDANFREYANAKREKFIDYAYGEADVLSIERLVGLIERLTRNELEKE